MPSNITLFIPQLIYPLKTWQQDFGFEPQTPIFSMLFRHYKSSDTSCVGLYRSLFSALGLSNEEELPVAQYRYINNQITPKMLICADPVHCEVGINDITLTHVIDDLTRDEAEEIISQLNQHFSQDGLEFLLDEVQQWYLSLPQTETFESTELENVIGKNIFPFLPCSESRNWQATQNEVQMLLHLSGINQSREIAGLPTINSLWFWGGGQGFIAETGTNPVNQVFGNGDYTKIIAKAGKCSLKPLPKNGDEIVKTMINHEKQGDVFVILDQLVNPALSNDLESWQQQVNNLEQLFLEPLMHGLKQGKITLQIDSCDGQRITPLKIPTLKAYFVKPKSLLKL